MPLSLAGVQQWGGGSEADAVRVSSLLPRLEMGHRDSPSPSSQAQSQASQKVTPTQTNVSVSAQETNTVWHCDRWWTHKGAWDTAPVCR